jgi:hypothetical protein
MNYLKISLGVFIALGVSRFVPHPPNFTSLLALSFYVPILLGTRFIPALIIAFIITDFFIGFHNVQIFTWGSIVLIGLLSKKFTKNTLSRIVGSLFGACLFFLITNFGVWSLGSYEYSVNGFILCFTLAIPFFAYSLISTLLFSTLIEAVIKFKNINLLKSHLK